MAESGSLTVYPGAYDQSDYSFSTITNYSSPVGKGSGNTTYADIKGARNATGHIRWPFDLAGIPAGAKIDSVVCNAKVDISAINSIYTKLTLQLATGTTLKGSSVTFAGTNPSVLTLDQTGAWTRDELISCNLLLEFYTSASSADQRNIYFYGADLTVTYTYQNEKFMLRLTPSAGDESLLPSGYTRLENIQCTGAQYADLGFKPNTNTRFVMDCQAKATNSGGVFPFGVRAGLSDRAFAAALVDSQVFYNYGSSYEFADYPNVLERMTIDANAFSAVFKGSSTVTISLTTVTFTCGSNLLVGTFSNAGTPSAGENAWNGSIWSCQAYDNGTLIRDCYPCLNPNGVPGLYDIVNGVFYGSATSATFVAGPEYNKVWHDIARVFKKVNGIWVEQTDLANVIEDGVRYQNGGEHVAPKPSSYTVTITGAGVSTTGCECYVEIGGVRHTSATAVEVQPGTTMRCYGYGGTVDITLNGAQVGTAVGGNSSKQEYLHTVNENCAVNLSYTTGFASTAKIAITTQ